MKKMTILAAAAVLSIGIAAAHAQGAGGAGGGGESGAANTEKKAPNKEQPGTNSGASMSAPMAVPSSSAAVPAPKEGKTGDAVTTTGTAQQNEKKQ